MAIAGANKSAIHIVDPASGDDMTLPGHESGSWDVSYVGDGDRLASAGHSGELSVWVVTADGPPELGALRVQPGDVWGMSFSPDGGELTVSTSGSGVEVLATATGERLASLAGQLIGLPGGTPPTSADGRLVASLTASDGRAAVRELPSLTTIMSLPPCTAPVAFSADGAALLLDGSVCAAGEFALFEPGPEADLRSRVIEVPSGREILDLGVRRVTSAAFVPGGRFAAGRYLAVSFDFESIEIYDMVTRDRVARHGFGDQLSFGPSTDPQGRWLTGSTTDGRVWVIDLAALVDGATWDDALILNQAAHTTNLPGPRLNADGILATRGFGDGFVRLWEVATGDMIVELRADPTEGFTVTFSPDGNHLYYADTGDVIRRYPLDTDELVELAESRLTRGFTADECRRYLDAPNAHDPTCFSGRWCTRRSRGPSSGRAGRPRPSGPAAAAGRTGAP
ncbi:MAG: WD40 repeat domain-containing protein [Acidimicrobiales bacterium]